MVLSQPPGTSRAAAPGVRASTRAGRASALAVSRTKALKGSHHESHCRLPGFRSAQFPKGLAPKAAASYQR